MSLSKSLVATVKSTEPATLPRPAEGLAIKQEQIYLRGGELCCLFPSSARMMSHLSRARVLPLPRLIALLVNKT